MTDKPIEDWEQAPAALSLPMDEVHVWQALLGSDVLSLESYRAILSEDEVARANRFHFKRDRTRFAAARGILRKLLSTFFFFFLYEDFVHAQIVVIK